MTTDAAHLDARTRAAYERVATQLAPLAGPGAPVVGICGAQGSGKSTLAEFLREYLREHYGHNVIVIAIDDLYLGKAEREGLARDVHPLLRTRGVPGTHDMGLGQALFSRLQELEAGASLRVPVFDKSIDDRVPDGEWSTVRGPVDLILFEGWCVGVPPEPDERLREPVNALESREDPEGRWRRAVNGYLAGEYARVYAGLASLIFLQIPGWEMALTWRREQEDGNRARGRGQGMSELELQRFMQHYERLTRWALDVMPSRCDIHLQLDHDHSVATMSGAVERRDG